ncbi:E3 ubiquitin-protein ligase trim9-like protein [Plakobranchus ocellatus]|uniref:E3 ubiquitin-protein ligase trim9-like protein n=1 Tax=Plakobranchus ocellatus TaxID=259542 RepID=A0AAV4DXJ4_9GAST|nr:E3 ubiquitin-protein ligase trim9-like protein [Plakobranchus ocellatus]
MADSVSGNCAEFEKTVVSQCDALIEVIKQRKAELLENVAEEKDMKVRTLKEQVSDCTALLQRTTGLLQFCIEVLKESDAPSFLQVSAGLVSRVATADANFNKEMELAPRVSPEFELTIDNTQAIHAIESMSFFQMKASWLSMCNVHEDCAHRELLLGLPTIRPSRGKSVTEFEESTIAQKDLLSFIINSMTPDLIMLRDSNQRRMKK